MIDADLMGRILKPDYDEFLNGESTVIKTDEFILGIDYQARLNELEAR